MRGPVFLPLSFRLKDGETVFLAFKKNGAPTKVPVGSVRTWNEDIGHLEFYQEGGKEQFIWKGWTIKIKHEKILKSIAGASLVCDVLLGDRVIFKATIGGDEKISLEKNGRGILYLRGVGEYSPENDPFVQKEGVLDLVLTDKNGGEERCPLFAYKFVSQKGTIVNPYRDLMAQVQGFGE